MVITYDGGGSHPAPRMVMIWCHSLGSTKTNRHGSHARGL
jgi:hypothetical protein